MRAPHPLRTLIWASVFTLFGKPVAAQQAEFVLVSPQRPVELAPSTVAVPNQLAQLLPASMLNILSLPSMLPANVGVSGLSIERNLMPESLGVLLALDQSVAGFRRGQIIRCVAGTPACSVLLDIHATLGIPQNVRLDALARDNNNDRLYLSFDHSVEYGSTIYAPQSVLGLNIDSGVVETLLDPRSLGLPANVNLNAAATLDGSLGYFAISSPAVIGGQTAMPGELLTPQGAVALQLPLADNLGPSAISTVDSGRISFPTASNSFVESAGRVHIRILRINGSEGPVEVEVVAVDGSATQPDDYVAVNGTVASFAFADNGSNSVDIPIDIIDNATVDGPRQFERRLRQTTPDSRWLLIEPNDTITVTILDNDDTDSLFEDGFE